jgi:hypothetical protein
MEILGGMRPPVDPFRQESLENAYRPGKSL